MLSFPVAIKVYLCPSADGRHPLFVRRAVDAGRARHPVQSLLGPPIKSNLPAERQGKLPLLGIVCFDQYQGAKLIRPSIVLAVSLPLEARALLA
jgi:hypothetical protein